MSENDIITKKENLKGETIEILKAGLRFLKYKTNLSYNELWYQGKTIYQDYNRLKNPKFKIEVKSCCYSFYKPLRIKINGKLITKTSFNTLDDLERFVLNSKSKSDKNFVIMLYKGLKINLGECSNVLEHGEKTLINHFKLNKEFCLLMVDLWNKI